MESLCISSTVRPFCYTNSRRCHCNLFPSSASALPRASTSFDFNPLRFSIKSNDKLTVDKMMKKQERGFGVACYASPLAVGNLHWISAISSVVLMFAKGTAIHKSFLVPLLALQAPSTVISWIKGDYGIWSAFLALLVRLFFFIPGELELPFMALVLVLVAPYQVLNLRGTQEGAIIALVIAGYLGFQHFTRAGSMQKSFEQGSIVASLAVVCIVVVSCLLLI